MYRDTLVLLCLLFSGSIFSQNWAPAGDRLKTPWAGTIDPNAPLPEYPRPELERAQWQNLNGLWDYCIQPAGSALPSSYAGKILVPFAIESALSGVQKTVGGENELWYHRTFSIPTSWKGKNIILNFGAVDWKCDIWINGMHIGSHKGGYTAFSFDISPWISESNLQELDVRVWDPTDNSFQPRGKQVSEPGGIWYTAVTGIWQTVWIEPASEVHLTSLRSIPDFDRKTVAITPQVNSLFSNQLVQIRVVEDGKIVAQAKGIPGQEILIGIPQAKTWSPETPFLYELEASLLSNGKVTDKVKSYFGMRKIATRRDAQGIVRLQLNNTDYFQFGPLDQGWWPDGLYTAPTDEALKYDIVKTKELGFNMIRKHVKVESARWYYHCDREGILVWQDMPSGDESPEWQMTQYFNGKELQRTNESEENYRTEWKAIIDQLVSHPCIVTWVPFNECWGQFKTREITEWTKHYNPSRLVNPASGGNFYPVGDMLDIHHYPGPELTLYDNGRACVQGEYGGIGLAIADHVWSSDRNWGYVQYKTAADATDEYVKMANQLLELAKRGFSAAVYTQTTDVENEVNGLMTYDRRIMKLDIVRLHEINTRICDVLKK
jgi:beta-galactosidase/beta-glucuronidase